MEPSELPQLSTDRKEQDRADEKACGEKVAYWLKRYNCTLVPIMELRSGQVAARIDLQKIPPEVLKQMRQAEKEGRSGPVGPQPASA